MRLIYDIPKMLFAHKPLEYVLPTKTQPYTCARL